MRYGSFAGAINRQYHPRALPLHLVKATAGRLAAKGLRTPYSQKLIIGSEETQFESGKCSASQLKRRSDRIVTRQETRNGAPTHRKPADDEDSSLISRKPKWRNRFDRNILRTAPCSQTWTFGSYSYHKWNPIDAASETPDFKQFMASKKSHLKRRSRPNPKLEQQFLKEILDIVEHAELRHRTGAAADAEQDKLRKLRVVSSFSGRSRAWQHPNAIKCFNSWQTERRPRGWAVSCEMIPISRDELPRFARTLSFRKLFALNSKEGCGDRHARS
jgi:hypothetical protein